MARELVTDKSPLTYDIVVSPMELMWFRSWRRKLLSKVRGEVLDIGSGTGANLRYYPEEIDCVTVIDPSTTNIAYLKRKAKGQGWGEESSRCLRSRIGVGEDLPFEDSQFDTVVSTLILCTVKDPERVIDEGVRVLKRGGRFIFMEHQLPRWKPQALIFNAAAPIWRAPSGCNLNRHTEELIRKRGDLIELESGRKGPVLGFPFFAGVFEKRG